jgi:hypothetical protein
MEVGQRKILTFKNLTLDIPTPSTPGTFTYDFRLKQSEKGAYFGACFPITLIVSDADSLSN